MVMTDLTPNLPRYGATAHFLQIALLQELNRVAIGVFIIQIRTPGRISRPLITMLLPAALHAASASSRLDTEIVKYRIPVPPPRPPGGSRPQELTLGPAA